MLRVYLKTIGRVVLKFTAFPLMVAGIHFGMFLTKSRAALSNRGSALFVISTLLMCSVFSTIKATNTFPVIFLSLTFAG